MSSEGAAVAPRRLGLGRVAFDMLMVIGSVLLALALDDWRDNREKRALTQNVLIALVQMAILVLADTLPHIRSGRLRAIAPGCTCDSTG